MSFKFQSSKLAKNINSVIEGRQNFLWTTLVVVLSITAISNCQKIGDNNSDSDSTNEFQGVLYDGYKGGEIRQLVANEKIGSSQMDMQFPIKLTDELEIQKIEFKKYGFSTSNNSTATITWEAGIRNKSNKEVSAIIDVCSSEDSALRIKPDTYFLVECSPITIKLGSQGTNKFNFASAQPWSAMSVGRIARLCIKDIGCTEKLVTANY